MGDAVALDDRDLIELRDRLWAALVIPALTVAIALNERERSGRGQRVEIPLFDATFSVVGARGLLVNGKPVDEPEFNWSRQLPCKDGRWLMYVANNKRFEAFIQSIGMDKWRDAKLPPQERSYRVGEHCKFCPARGTCPAWLTDLRAFAALIEGTHWEITTKNVAALVDRASLVERLTRAVRDAAKEFVRAQGGTVVTDDGREVGVVHTFGHWRDLDTQEFRPLLATKWTWIDRKTLEVELRKGVKFHNGDDFDADDVVYTMNWASDPKSKVIQQVQAQVAGSLDLLVGYGHEGCCSI